MPDIKQELEPLRIRRDPPAGRSRFQTTFPIVLLVTRLYVIQKLRAERTRSCSPWNNFRVQAPR